MATGSFSDYARHIGASPAYVSKLKSQGRDTRGVERVAVVQQGWHACG